MAPAQLRLLPPAEENPFVRSQRLMSEARKAADEHVTDFEGALFLVAQLAAEIGQGGDAYPQGVRDLASKIADDAAWCGQTTLAIMRSLGRAPVYQDER